MEWLSIILFALVFLIATTDLYHLWDEYVGISLFNIIFLIKLVDVC